MTRSFAAPHARMARSRLARARAICLALVLALIAPLAGSCSGDVYGGADPEDMARALAIVPTCPTRGTRAHDVRVEQVALYQAVKIPLYQDGRWLTERAAPIIAGKAAMVRVFVRPDDDYRPRSLRAVLRIAHGDHVVPLAEERRLRARSRDDQLASTFNIDVAADLLTPDARLSVALEETDCALSPAAEARAAAAVVTPLAAEARQTLRVVLVPLRVGGRVPELTTSSVAYITDALRAFFPVPDVEVRVDDVQEGLDAVPALNRNPGARDKVDPAWNEMLERVGAVRTQRAPEDDVYYVGLFVPAATRAEYCVQGCTQGLAHHTSASDARHRYAVAAFFGDDVGGETVAHELGHAHGLEHVYCPGMPRAAGKHDDDGFEHDYPVADGRLDTWGWDARTATLIPPTAYDLMSYCHPYGISTYSYAKLAERTRRVDKVARTP